jgi:hypothetical protein
MPSKRPRAMNRGKSVPQRLKPSRDHRHFGTAEAVPFVHRRFSIQRFNKKTADVVGTCSALLAA